MDQLIDEHLERMAELGQADRRNGCDTRWLLTELGAIELAVPPPVVDVHQNLTCGHAVWIAVWLEISRMSRSRRSEEASAWSAGESDVIVEMGSGIALATKSRLAEEEYSDVRRQLTTANWSRKQVAPLAVNGREGRGKVCRIR